jgi:3-hydroxyisobutyrate dehydrogenase-like beta-hydroxyacid dehydrogenase
MKRIGIVGVGLLGSAVASRLRARGFEVAGYDRRPEPPARLLAALRDRPVRNGAMETRGPLMAAVIPTLETRRNEELRPPC